jgi:hypothetical protein
MRAIDEHRTDYQALSAALIEARHQAAETERQAQLARQRWRATWSATCK